MIYFFKYLIFLYIYGKKIFYKKKLKLFYKTNKFNTTTMGRYWSATTNNGYTCEGKFWFAVQNSDDFINVGFIPSSTQRYYYNLCRCCIYENDPETITDWCENCYNTREEFYQEMEEEEEHEPFYLDYSESIYNYEVNYDDLLERLDTPIMKNISKYLLEFNSKMTDSYSIQYDYSIVGEEDTIHKKTLSDEEEELLATYVLIKIVKSIIDLTGCESIKVYCEN